MLGVCAVAAACLVAGTNVWVRADAGARAFASAELIPARTVAIVPGADVFHGRAKGTLERRLETALELYRAGRVKAILASGNDTVASPEVSAMRAWLREHGVPEPDIWSDPRGARTRDTMLNAASVFDVKDAVICTQAPYVDRALFLARHAGIDAVGVGLPSPVSHSARGLGLEAIKTTVSFVESYLRGVPSVERVTAHTTAVVAVR